MFMKFKVPVPEAHGKLVRKNRGGEMFIEYEYDRTYDPVKQITYPKRASIGKVDKDTPDQMYPNQNIKGMKDFIRGIVLKNQGTFEGKRIHYIDRYDVYGTSVECVLFEGDEKKKHVHLYYSDSRAYGEKQEIKARIRRGQRRGCD